MAAPQKNDFLSRYCVIKHSWKGKYTRLFCVGRSSIATINPSSIFLITNQWEYPLVVDVVPSVKVNTDIVVTVRKSATSGSTDTTTFSCQSYAERAELLTDIQRMRHRFDPQWMPTMERQVFGCRKYKSNEEWKPIVLQVTNVAVLQRNGDGKIVGEYQLMHINGVGQITGTKNTLVIRYGLIKKLHLYSCDNAEALIKLIKEMAAKYLGLAPAPAVDVSQYDFDNNRLGIGRTALVPTGEFRVSKISAKHDFAPVGRILGTTEKYIVERDPATYNAISVFALKDVAAFIRCEDDSQKFMIEYKAPNVVKTYTSSSRDALLAHFVDACRSILLNNVCVQIARSDRGKRAAPMRCFVSEEIESTLLKCLVDPVKCGGVTAMPFTEVVEFFNANVEYSGLRSTENKDGLFAENREKLIFGAVTALLENFPVTEDPHVLVQQFYALRRLCVCRTGFASIAVVPHFVKAIGGASVKALKLHNTAVSHAVIDFLNALMTPMHDNFEPYHEQVNKHRMLSSESFIKHLLVLLKNHISEDSGAIVIQSLLEFFVYALCPPYSETTVQETFLRILTHVVDVVGKPIFALLHHPCKAIRYSSGMIISVILEEGGEDQFFAVQRASLTEGGFLKQFHTAAFSQERDMRDLARRLIGFFTYDHQTAQDLLRRVVPLTLLHFLQAKDQPPDDELVKEKTMDVSAATQEFRDAKTQGWFKKTFNPKDVLQKPVAGEETPVESVIYRARTLQVQPNLNWAMFFFQLKLDHARPDLIWTHNTRTELREALETEISQFQLGLEMRKERAVCWNYAEFEVQYPSLGSELRIGNHYPRLLFEAKNPQIARPKEFFNDMYHRFLLVQDFDMKCQCLQGMAILYKHYAEDIGVFNDIEYLLQMLDNTDDPIFRDRMLTFLSYLIHARLNVKPFIDRDGVRPLMELMPLAHLHIDRPQLHTNTMAIEAVKGEDLQDKEPEWYYVTAAGEKAAPVSFSAVKRLYKEGVITEKTKMWAQGLGGWKPMKEIAQMKWGILAEGKRSILTLTEVTCTVLDMLMHLCAYFPTRDEDGAIMQPIPRVKRFLSDPAVLPHIVQLLATFDPAICSRVNRLLQLLMEDNPMMPRLFLTGYFFFSMMYTGSDIVPMARLLHVSHNKQGYRCESDNEIIRHSILSPLLPPAMVCVLQNHGPQKFAEIFLGEYETPEAIWGKDMRRYLIEKIAGHLYEFTPRLLGNVRAQYSYCPIVGVEYNTLKNELFCSMYYLRHLCDEAKYPTWPIRDPIALLRDVLATWKRELEKEPSSLNRTSCLETLDLADAADPSPSQIRKAYFKLAQVYHPDKNPNGREQFEAIQRAYEFLASNTEASDAPDSRRIYLLLRTQSILFSRCAEELKKYKYAGYALLLKLIHMEQADDAMLTKDVCLMDPAIELCYHSVDNCALNADELQAEGGVELIAQVLNRCFELVTPSVKDHTLPGKIVTNSLRTFAVAAKFDECLRRIVMIPLIAIHSARAIAYSSSPSLSRAGILACQAYCAIPPLQDIVTHAGAIWHLLLYIFKYDYTLEESGVEMSEKHHTQLFANVAAKHAFRCICALAGYHPNPEDIQSAFNRVLHDLLVLLLTQFVVTSMQSEPNAEAKVLKLLNSNHETPYFLWNNTTRAELKDFIEHNSAICRDGASNPAATLPSMKDVTFEYSSHTSELIVGGIFVRIYNLQPTYPITQPEPLMQALIDHSLTSLGDAQLDHLDMDVDAMRNLLLAYPMTSQICARNLVALMKLLGVKGRPSILAKVFDFLAKCCNHLECIETLGQIPTAVGDIAVAMGDADAEVYKAGLSLMHRALGDRDVVQQTLDRGLYVVLLYIFTSCRVIEVREEACVCIAKACMDKLNGPKIFLRAQKLMPAIFLDTMKENPSQVCQMFETWQENPELVWNAQVRDRVNGDVARAKSDVVSQLSADRTFNWKLTDEFIPPVTTETLQVGGVYLSLFVKQPSWAVRRPRDFLQALMEKFLEVAGTPLPARDKEVLELLVTSTVNFISGQPSVADFLVAIGCIPRLLRLAADGDDMVAKGTVMILHEVASSKACIASMTNLDPIAPLMMVIPKLPDSLGVIMDTLERIVSRSSEYANMLKCALANELPQRLLEMLETGMRDAAFASSARAIIIKVLKSMAAVEDPVYGPQLAHLLSDSTVWKRYKDQNHDLFLTSAAFGGFLTGPKAGPVLSLAAPPAASGMGDTVPPDLSP